MLPKKLRYLIFCFSPYKSISNTLFPPNLKFLHINLLSYLDKHESHHQLDFTLENPLTTLVLTEDDIRHGFEYTIDHIDTVGHIYIETQFKLPNVPCKSTVHYHPTNKKNNLTDLEYDRMLFLSYIQHCTGTTRVDFSCKNI